VGALLSRVQATRHQVDSWVALDVARRQHAAAGSPSLKLVQPLVRDFCAERGVPNLECGLLGSYRQAVGISTTSLG
jgi:hypothetical protein